MITAAIGAAVVNWEEGASCSGSSLPPTRWSTTPWADPARGAGADGALPGGGDRAARRPGAGGPVEELRLGDEVVVRPGERVAVDGCVWPARPRSTSRRSPENRSPLSSGPVTPASRGRSTVTALRVRVDRLHQESTLARIVQFVEGARRKEPPSVSPTVRGVVRGRGHRVLDPGRDSPLVSAGARRPPSTLPRHHPSGRRLALCAGDLHPGFDPLRAGQRARNGILFKGGASLEASGRPPSPSTRPAR